MRTTREIRIAEQRKIVRATLKKMKRAFSKLESLYNELPQSVQNNTFEIHNPNYALGNLSTNGEQCVDELLEKKTFKQITKDL